MDDTAYKLYVECRNTGRRRQTKAALEAFLASVRPDDDICAWTKVFLEREDYDHLIRHEIYERLIFPVLRQGYERDEPWSLLWLARTANNLHRCPALQAQIGYQGERELLGRAYELQPSDEARRLLLNADLRWFAYCQHEWPAGILYGRDGTSLAECDDILARITFARGLDIGDNEEFLNDFESKVREYKSRLQNSSRGFRDASRIDE